MTFGPQAGLSDKDKERKNFMGYYNNPLGTVELMTWHTGSFMTTGSLAAACLDEAKCNPDLATTCIDGMTMGMYNGDKVECTMPGAMCKSVTIIHSSPAAQPWAVWYTCLPVWSADTIYRVSPKTGTSY